MTALLYPENLCIISRMYPESVSLDYALKPLKLDTIRVSMFNYGEDFVLVNGMFECFSLYFSLSMSVPEGGRTVSLSVPMPLKFDTIRVSMFTKSSPEDFVLVNGVSFRPVFMCMLVRVCVRVRVRVFVCACSLTWSLRSAMCTCVCGVVCTRM